MKKWCIGLTGGLASGKSTVTKMLINLGATVIDADEVGRALTANANSAGMAAVREALGSWAFDEKGNLRRDEVRRRVFADSALRKKLESALHPLIQQEMRKEIQNANADLLILSVPLLFESGVLLAECSRIAVVDCEIKTQIKRACNRDTMNAQMAQDMINAQMPREERQNRADDIINNDGDLPTLQKNVESFYEKWKSICASILNNPPESPLTKGGR